MSATSSTTRLSSLQSQYYTRQNQRTMMSRSGSDQHLPRVEYDYGNDEQNVYNLKECISQHTFLPIFKFLEYK